VRDVGDVDAHTEGVAGQPLDGQRVVQVPGGGGIYAEDPAGDGTGVDYDLSVWTKPEIRGRAGDPAGSGLSKF
jgi:hypothetical protein